MPDTRRLIDTMLADESPPRAWSAATRNRRCADVGGPLDRTRAQPHLVVARALGGTRRRSRRRARFAATTRPRSSRCRVRRIATRRSAVIIRQRSDWSVTIRDLYGIEAGTRARSTSVARSRPMERCVIRWRAIASTPSRFNVRVSDRRRRRIAPDRGWPGSRRHHRARSFPLLRQRRNSGASRGATGLRAQGHRIVVAGCRVRPRGASRGAIVGRQHRRRVDRVRTRGRSRDRCHCTGPRAVVARVDGRTRTHCQPSRRHRRCLQRRIVHADARALRRVARTRAACVPHARSVIA